VNSVVVGLSSFLGRCGKRNRSAVSAQGCRAADRAQQKRTVRKRCDEPQDPQQARGNHQSVSQIPSRARDCLGCVGRSSDSRAWTHPAFSPRRATQHRGNGRENERPGSARLQRRGPFWSFTRFPVRRPFPAKRPTTNTHHGHRAGSQTARVPSRPATDYTVRRSTCKRHDTFCGTSQLAVMPVLGMLRRGSHTLRNTASPRVISSTWCVVRSTRASAVCDRPTGRPSGLRTQSSSVTASDQRRSGPVRCIWHGRPTARAFVVDSSSLVVRPWCSAVPSADEGR